MGGLIRYFRFCSTMPLTDAYLYAFGLSMCALMLAIWHHPYFYQVQRAGMQIRVACCGLIYKKVEFTKFETCKFSLFRFFV